MNVASVQPWRFLMLRVFLFAIVFTFAVDAEPATLPSADVAKVAAQIVEQTNAFRRDNKLPGVKPNDTLTHTAKEFAEYMARTGKYGHEADGRTPAQRVEAAGYQYAVVAENIQMQYSSRDFTTDDLAHRAVEGWKNSPGHRKNMLSTHATETGVGVSRSDDGHYYA